MRFVEKAGNEGTRRFHFLPFIWIMAVYLLWLAVLLLRGRGISYGVPEQTVSLLTDAQFREAAGSSPAQTSPAQSGTAQIGTAQSSPAAQTSPETLVIYEDDKLGMQGLGCISEVFREMGIGFDSLPAGELDAGRLSRYTKAVISVTNLTEFGPSILDLLSWVKKGNSMLFLYAPAGSGMFQMILNDLGIVRIGEENTTVNGLHFTENIMPGCQLRDFQILDAFDSALTVNLDNDAEVFMESTGEYPVPLLWRWRLGQGTVVFDNLNIFDKAYRGFHCAAYSLLGGACAWPVINGAAFYLDDFPAPVPEGDNRYISEDFGMSIEEFYVQHWWKDVSSLARDYGIRYTGVAIEEYSDQVEAPFDRNHTVNRFRYFGGMLLRLGGEIGFHGYNHMPLVLRNFDFRSQYASYRQWNSYADMREGLAELDGFLHKLFPKLKFQVYVPPSNVISEEGIELLARDFPQIRAIASVYIAEENGVEYEQEFEVAENGMVQTPRVISGYILEDFSRIAALSELTLHCVSSHFQHPDDVLDADRGADLGWEKMFSNLSDYAGWLDQALPSLRMLTGSEIAAAVQRYDALRVRKKEDGKTVSLELDGFLDEAWCYIRLNRGTPAAVDGGELTKAGADLYLLKAEQPRITITLDGSGQ